MTIDILGTKYLIVREKVEDNPKLTGADGICEPFSKKLVINDFKYDPNEMHENIDDYKRKVLRHEIVHAFLHESGLSNNSDWATNEEIVDWMALQIPKIWRAFKETECI